MTKNHNMGRKSHKTQDVELEQNLNGLGDELREQPVRPSTHPRQGTKSASEEPRDTK